MNDKILELSATYLKGKRLNAKTQNMLLANQGEFLAWTAKKGYLLNVIGPEELKDYHRRLRRIKSKRTGAGLAASTINNKFHAVYTLFTMLRENEIIKKSPFYKFNIVLRGIRGTSRRTFSIPEISMFLSKFDTNTPQGLKDRTLFELIYSSGLRVAEAASLKIKDISFERREMIVRGKGDKDRIIPFTAEAQKWLYLYLGNRINIRESWVFPGRGKSHKENHVLSTSISERFKNLLAKFDMARKGISTHSIRHTTATQLLENGAGIFFIQDLLGHKNPETTVRYTHLQIEQLQKVYLKYHPFANKSFTPIREKYLKGINSLFSAKQGKTG
ncbi:hypothetical protein FACS1894130_05000 [Spirochaetia bacterium]|nr:hypothetical protein FACS1894130_05000 [Spirochaetia bacterium]